MLYLGCHLSSSKGYAAMGRTALSIGANTFQFFTRNPRGGAAKSADPADAQAVRESTLLSNPAWSTLTAVKEGRYYVMDQTLFNLKPDARWGEAYEQLADILYPAG